jgi:hypothetical protein
MMIAQRAAKASVGLAPAVLKSTPKVEPLTCSIGAEIRNINLGIPRATFCRWYVRYCGGRGGAG